MIQIIIHILQCSIQNTSFVDILYLLMVSIPPSIHRYTITQQKKIAKFRPIPKSTTSQRAGARPTSTPEQTRQFPKPRKKPPRFSAQNPLRRGAPVAQTPPPQPHGAGYRPLCAARQRSICACDSQNHTVVHPCAPPPPLESPSSRSWPCPGGAFVARAYIMIMRQSESRSVKFEFVPAFNSCGSARRGQARPVSRGARLWMESGNDRAEGGAGGISLISAKIHFSRRDVLGSGSADS